MPSRRDSTRSLPSRAESPWPSWLSVPDADPAAALARTRVPTLLICGSADDNIPMRHSLELYEAGRTHSSLWIVPGAQHTGADVIDPAGFEQHVIGWFADHARAAPAL